MTEVFSPLERRVIKILGNRKKTIARITSQLYRDDLPFGANNRVAAIVRRINAKCEHHDLPWFLNGFGSGRGGKTVWRDKR